MNLPNLFIIGAPKCGTTSLYEYLNEHSEVFFTIDKEPHYFCSDFPHYQKVQTLEKYMEMFENALKDHQIMGEASTNYLYSAEAVPNILKFNAQAKFILLLRHPIDLVRSLHQHLIYRQLEPEINFEKAWQLGRLGERMSDKMKKFNVPSHIVYKECGKLGKYTQRVLEAVPPDQMKIIFFDDLIENPKQTYLDTLDFLNLSKEIIPDFSPKNKAKQSRLPYLTRFMMYPPFPFDRLKSKLKFIFTKFDIRPRGNLYELISVRPRKPSISPEFYQYLLNYYTDDILLLAKLTGRNLSHWIYPLDGSEKKST